MRQAAKNRWFSVRSHLFFIPFFTHKELCELPMKSAFRQNAEAQKFVQQKTTLAAAGQWLYNQTKKQKGRFSSEHQDHSKAVRRHRISVPAAPPAPRCTERCRCGRAVLHAAGSMGRVHRCALPAPQRRHPAGTGLTGHAALRHRGPPPDRKHRRTVDAGSHRCQRLRRLYPARQLRHLRHPAHRRRHGRAAALAV